MDLNCFANSNLTALSKRFGKLHREGERERERVKEVYKLTLRSNKQGIW